MLASRVERFMVYVIHVDVFEQAIRAVAAMQGTLGGSLRPCTSLLHKSLPLVSFAHRSLVTCNRDGSDDGKTRMFQRAWPRQDSASTLRLGARRHLAVVAAKRSMLSELQSIREEADAGTMLISLSCFTDVEECTYIES